MVSRYRLVAAAITAIFIASACSGATPSSAPASVAPAPSATVAEPAPSASAAGQDFTGVTVELLTFNGPQIAEPLQRRAPDFEALTGAKINVVAVGFQEIYDKAILDLSTGTNSFDAFVFNPQWLGDFTGPGYLEDLTSRVESDPVVDWQDVGPFFRDFNATYGGKVYTIPLDGDFHMVYYRSDLIDTPPKTWDDYLAVAAEHHGKDLNGDGEPDYGSCIAKKKGQQSFWWIISVAGGLLQSKGTGEGAFFDTTTMQPLLNNEAFAKALDTYKKTMDFGPPDEINLGVGDTRGLFTTGRCALSMDWGDIGTLALDPATSTVQDKVGAVITPGWTQTLDRATGKLVACDATTCPNAVDGVNYAPFASFGGWSGAINAAAAQEKKDAAYAFLAYMSAPAQSSEDVTLGKTGFNPYRTSHFETRDVWKAVGMSDQAADNYLGAIEASLQNPNMVLDLRIPKTKEYEQDVLDVAVSQYIAGELNAEETMQQITDGWNQITDQVGRDAQLKAYQDSLGVQR
ncbi:MAG: putative transporter solute-binding protein [Chloroflexota bacterium]|nr:putative transporter solute-binding protein [Chloroflexota bacterium]